MIDRHAVKEMLGARVRVGDVARHFGCSRRTIERIRRVGEGDDGAARRARRVGRPPVAGTVRERMRVPMATEAESPPLEALWELREGGWSWARARSTGGTGWSGRSCRGTPGSRTSAA